MMPPYLTLGAQHAGARAECENPPDRVDPGVVVDVVLQDALDPVRVADDEEAAPEEAALDDQFLE